MLVDSLLLSYIDVQHANFLSPSLTTSEAQDLGLRYITAKDRAPVRDESKEHVSLSRKVHVPIEAPNAPAQVAKPVEAKTDQDTEMVTRRKMIVDRFIPGNPKAGTMLPPPRQPPPPAVLRRNNRLVINPPKSLAMLR